jgi:hypothetical protein
LAWCFAQCLAFSNGRTRFSRAYAVGSPDAAHVHRDEQVDIDSNGFSAIAGSKSTRLDELCARRVSAFANSSSIRAAVKDCDHGRMMARIHRPARLGQSSTANRVAFNRFAGTARRNCSRSELNLPRQPRRPFVSTTIAMVRPRHFVVECDAETWRRAA